MENEKLKSQLRKMDERLDSLELGRGGKTAGLLSVPFGSAGWAVGGLAVVSSLLISRRKKSEQLL